MIRVGIIGAGNISKSHALAMSDIDGVQLVSVADIVLERAVELKDAYGARSAYSDYKQMIGNSEIDAVVINLPHGLHKEAAVYCANNGLHILLEKPMANTVEECRSIIEAVKRNGVKLMIGHLQRYSAKNIKVKELIDTGEFGQIAMITDVRTIDYFIDDRPKWFFDKKIAGGGIMLNYGAHSIDKMFYLTGRKIKKASGRIHQHLPDFEIEGNAQILIEFEDNITAVVSYSAYKGPTINETVIYLTNGVIKLSTGNNILVNKKDEFAEIQVGANAGSFKSMWGDFADSIDGDKTISADGDYGKEIIAVIQEIYSQNI